MATVDFEDAGYIKDDDARHGRPSELLDELKQEHRGEAAGAARGWVSRRWKSRTG